jgi:hypothetical protein
MVGTVGAVEDRQKQWHVTVMAAQSGRAWWG